MRCPEEAVRVSNLTVRYPGNPAPALCGVNLGLEAGECVVVSGPSGCGKSTLALCLTGFIPHAVDAAVTGGVRVEGLDPTRVGVYELAQFVGLVQQDPEAQFCTTRVQDEVAFGPENLMCPAEEIARRVDWALDAVVASHLRGRTLAELSGGEKQRVALAAVLAMRPSVLILDEPTAHLDPRATGALVRLLSDMRARLGLAVMILEHRPERFFGIACRVVQLSQGAVVFNGPPRELPGRGDGPSPFVPADAFPSSGGLLTGHTGLRGRGGEDGKGHWTGRTSARAQGRAQGRTQGGMRGTQGRTPGAPLLQVRGLSQRYGDRAVLQDVNLEVKHGEIVGVMGDNGSGKTTLLLSIMGILRPVSGKVVLEGDDITNVPVSARAKRIGMIFQNPNHQLFTDHVWREAVVGLLSRGVPEAVCRPAAEALLDRFDLLAFRDSHPLTLSYGQKRRLNLAAVMVSDPSVLLLDEPFVGQDAARAQDLAGLLDDLASSGKGILLVGHEPGLMARCCDRLLFLDGGRIVVDAPVREALADFERMGLYDYLPQAWA